MMVSLNPWREVMRKEEWQKVVHYKIDPPSLGSNRFKKLKSRPDVMVEVEADKNITNTDLYRTIGKLIKGIGLMR